MTTPRANTPTQLVYSAAEGLVYNRIPAGVTQSFPAPAPVFGWGNIMSRLLHIDSPLVYTTSVASPAGAYQVVGPRILTGFMALARGLPTIAVQANTPPMAAVPVPARGF